MAVPPAGAALNDDAQHGITKTTIRVAYYSAPPDVAGRRAGEERGRVQLAVAGGPDHTRIHQAFSKRVQLYGRKVQLVKLQGTGTSTDEQAAQADAVTAKNMNVFAVLGGPSQTKSFSQTLANEGILCIGSCELAQPGSFYKANSPSSGRVSSPIRLRRSTCSS